MNSGSPANACKRHGREFESRQVHRFSYGPGHFVDTTKLGIVFICVENIFTGCCFTLDQHNNNFHCVTEQQHVTIIFTRLWLSVMQLLYIPSGFTIIDSTLFLTSPSSPPPPTISLFTSPGSLSSVIILFLAIALGSLADPWS